MKKALLTLAATAALLLAPTFVRAISAVEGGKYNRPTYGVHPNAIGGTLPTSPYTFYYTPLVFAGGGNNAPAVAEAGDDVSTTDYSGLYYIRSFPNKGQSTYYLQPSNANDGSLVKTTNNGTDINAVWQLIRQGDYYQIVHHATGRYLSMPEDDMSDDLRLVLESTTTPGDRALFSIVCESGCTGAITTHNLLIKPKAIEADRTNCYLNVYGGNNGSNTIGLWTAQSTSFWRLNAIPQEPTISVSDINVSFSAKLGTVHYTTDGSTPTSASGTGGNVKLKYGPQYTVKAIAEYYDEQTDRTYTSTTASTTVQVGLLRPILSVSGNTVSITSPQRASVQFCYLVNDDRDLDPTIATTGTSITLDGAGRNTVRVIAYNIVDGVTYKSGETSLVIDKREAQEISSLADITSPTGNYAFAANFSATGTPRIGGDGDEIGTAANPFNGTLDGRMVSIELTADKPLFAYIKDATVCNVIVDTAHISTTGNAGAIVGTAQGVSRVYNCGVLAGSVGGTQYVGGIVGQLSNSSRVVNCFSYANITGGTYRAGIVGYNDYASTAVDIRTVVMNCMFYGDIAVEAGATISPVYGGKNIDNLQGGLNMFNYYRYDAPYSKQGGNIKDADYHCALALEERFLTRFEFYRLLLNSNRSLAAYYITNSRQDKDLLAKWVLEPCDNGADASHPYPILKAQGKYPSIINYDTVGLEPIDAENLHRNEGRKLGTLAVTVATEKATDGGQTWPAAARVNQTSLTLVRTDKNYQGYNFCSDKVQLPYYNDIAEGNYTDNRVVTGWKITAITGGDTMHYAEGDKWGGYNFADRRSTEKDLYAVTGRIFAQGAYYDVPYGVTAITIEPYWAQAAYLSDRYLDVVYYSNDYKVQEVTSIDEWYGNNGVKAEINGSLQPVYTSMATAVGKLSGSTVYDNAVVLVGNVHMFANPPSGNVPFTVMSADLDNDNEPDFSLILAHNDRKAVSPIRFDFVNVPGVAMAQKPNDATLYQNVTIYNPKGWFEITNTCLIYFTEFEYDNGSKTAAPLILLGGMFDQFVSTQKSNPGTNTKYIHLGGSAWFKAFGNGTHSDGKEFTPHIPISVTGGDYESFYLSGTYRPGANVKADDAECYISGGRFGELAGAAQQQINGNVQWQIYNADIANFYGGGINDEKPVTGNITVDIENSYVDTYCGGPKFGNMSEGKLVTTNAANCHFGTFFGAGYGGISYLRQRTQDEKATNFNGWQNNYIDVRGKYYNGKSGSGSFKDGYRGPGVAVDFDYEFFIWATGQTGGRFYVKMASLSLAQTKDVVANLNKCTITGNFYGGGNLGSVDGDITSTLTDCEVKGHVFGAGFQATKPKVPVRNAGFAKLPTINNRAGIFDMGEMTDTVEYTLEQGTFTVNASALDADSKTIITDVDLDNLGTVSGNVTLNLEGSTVVHDSVFGGGFAAKVTGVGKKVMLNMAGSKVHVHGDVYGGGSLADVSGSTEVNILAGTVDNSVYGGGMGSSDVAAIVGGDATVNIGSSTDEAVVADGITSYNSVVIGGNIFGGNNINGTPQGNINVNVWHTAHTADNMKPLLDDVEVLASKPHDAKYFALQGVYGGGNKADYVPSVAGNQATVYIHGCENTVKMVYGGGRAAAVGSSTTSANTSITVDGGRIDTLFAGGDGHTTNAIGEYVPADIYGNVSAHVRGGYYSAVFGGSNTSGTIMGTKSVKIDKSGPCNTDEELIGTIFGGGNKADAEGDVALTIDCGTGFFREVYGGCNLANINNGNVTLTLNGGTFERVYGGSRGTAETAANIGGNVVLNLHGGTISGSAFGGSNINGNITGSITVNVNDTSTFCPLVVDTVYGGSNQAQYIPTDAAALSPNNSPTVNLIKGTVGTNVFGAGRGSKTSVLAGLVASDPIVNMYGSFWVKGSIFGGGELATVGAFTYDANNLVTGHTSGGHTVVNIQGGSVGPDDMMMYDPAHPDHAPDFDGHVFGAGQGIAEDTVANKLIPSLAYVHSTDVTVAGESTFVKGSVYGGSRDGHVYDSTYVKIKGGQVGNGAGVNRIYTTTEWENSATLAACAHWDYDTNTNQPYDKYANTDAVRKDPDLDTGAVVATDGHTFYGNVFGGGSGYFPYAPGKWVRSAGHVGGNTRVEITGGHVLTSVYGGNEMTDVSGTCTVIMNGGTVGVPRTDPSELPVICNLYGAGKGDQRTAFNQWTNVGATNVKIYGTARIYGSVFGGGEDGHVLGNATTTIADDDVIIGTTGSSSVDGNVFGGGRGFSATALTAGVVCGNVDLTITGGHILGSVYGGGRLAAVGTYLADDADEDYYGMMQPGADHGNISVKISGGYIGNPIEMGKKATRLRLDRHELSIGDVFGGSKGWKRSHKLGAEGRQRLGLSKNTDVQITGGHIYGNVYGGGEIASVGDYKYIEEQEEADEWNAKYSGYGMKVGDVYTINLNSPDYDSKRDIGLARVTITGGTIGIEGGIDTTSEVLPANKRLPGRTVNHKGHVYGGCLGQAGSAFSGFSFVNLSRVTIGGDAKVVGSVFGGGENGHVLDSTYVYVKGGQVGMEPDSVEYIENNGQGIELYFGNVYGGGRGVDTVANTGDTLSPTAGRVRHSTFVRVAGGRVTHNVYGGGSLANTGIASDVMSGWARVVVDSVAVIGYDDTLLSYNDETMQYTYRGTDGKKQQHIDTLYARAGKNGGRVYGSARGEASETGSQLTHMAFTKYTSVTVGGRAAVRGSVFGGGENGHVRKDTYVTIQDKCHIGVPLLGADHDEDSAGVGPTIYRGNVYGGGRGLDSYVNAEGKHVFSLTAGRVYGNANVNISGGQIYGNVYGGGSLASVGDTVHIVVTDAMRAAGNDAFRKRYPQPGAYDILDSLITGQYHFKSSTGKDETSPYLVGDPISNTGVVTINVSGGVIGETGINEGRIYGSGRGIAGANTSQYTHMAFSNNTVVNILDGADIRGSVFGGGANGHVKQNAQVNVKGGVVGARLTLDDRMIDANGAPKQSVYRGNVYGGGRGVDPYDNQEHLSNTAGRVFGNTEVNVSGGVIRHGVYGGGSLASVGDYILDTVNKADKGTPGWVADVKHLYYEGTGEAHIRITGGVIGPKIDTLTGYNDLLYGKNNHKLDPTVDADLDTIRLNYHHIGANEGMVYGSGRGVAYLNDDVHRDYIEMAFTHNTFVEIDSMAYIYGSVFGGGENGHVREHTNVVIGGHAIVGGPALHDATPIDVPGMAQKLAFVDSTMQYTIVNGKDTLRVAAKDTAGRNVIAANIVFNDNEQVEDEHGVGMTVYRGNVYGGGRGVDNSVKGDQAVFSSSAGRVYGNTNVTIKDSAVVRRVVYGGGSVASVGTYTMFADGVTPQAATPIYHIERTADRADTTHGKPIATGIASVTIMGGVVGGNGVNEGHVYGGGRGIAGNVTDEVTHLAYCDSTHVYITFDTLNPKRQADIRGSVFGGGANGHVLRNTSVVMDAGIVGTPLRYAERVISATSSHLRVYRGNLYGGGRGVDPVENSNHLSASAGRVYGNTNVLVLGGVVRHNVYGGGSLASVGSFKNINNLFQELTEDYYEAAAKNLYISHAYLIGTGEAHVTIRGGRIGPLPEDLLYNPETRTLYDQTTINRNLACLGENEGQVYGSGRGVAYTPTDTNAAYAEMAFVKSTFVTIDSAAYICGSVFGGGENGHVRFDTHVKIMDSCLIGGIPLHDTTGYALAGSRFLRTDYGTGTDADFSAVKAKFNVGTAAVGTTEYKNIVELYELPTGVGRTMYRGNVYGGGRGVDHSNDTTGYSSSAGRVYGNTNIYIGGGHILHHVYGGGSIASVGNYDYDPADVDKLHRNPIAPRLAKYGYEYRDTNFFFNSVPTEDITKPATPMTSTDTMQHSLSGTINVTVVGGVIGVTGINEGRIYTAGRGIAGSRTDQVVHLAYCNTTNLDVRDSIKGGVVVSSPDIRGSVFGGGANGHVLNDAHVTVSGGDIGWGIAYYSDAQRDFSATDRRGKTSVTDPYNLIHHNLDADMALYEDKDKNGTTATIFRGNVYGGGRGVDPTGGGDQLSLTAGRIFGNTYVTITGGRVLHNVYGGGSMASVGDTMPCSAEHPCVDLDGNPITSGSGFGQFGDERGVATVSIGGDARIGWNGIDNNGHVFGSCRGEVAANYGSVTDEQYYAITYQYARLAYVRKSVVSVYGKADIRGSVLGGGANGHIEDSAVVVISGGTIGQMPDVGVDTIDARYQFCGNVYGGGRGVDVFNTNNFDAIAMHAGAVRGNTYVFVSDSAHIRRNVYGGGSMGIVGDYGMLGLEDTIILYQGQRTSGDANVSIRGYVGDSVLVKKFNYGGDVFGSSRGKADRGLADTVYDDMAYVFQANVLLDTGAHVFGSVYGGGENGHVDYGGTYVRVQQGRVRGSVYGGGKGTTGMPTAGVVDGSARVYIGRPTDDTNTVVIDGNVYGGNNQYSSPLDSTVVHIYRTAQRAGYNDTSATATHYAIANVFGGGNQASRLEAADVDGSNAQHVLRPKTLGRIGHYQSSTSACVYIHNCHNTVQRVFGGGNAAAVVGSVVEIDGGRFDTVFAGGNGEVTAANVGIKGTNAVVRGGVVNYLFAGSNKQGTITGQTVASIDTTGGNQCSFDVKNIFGGGNEAAAGGGEITIGCGTNFVNFYGGANNANINGDIVLNVNGGTFVNLFGGNNQGGTVSGDVTVNISGGNIVNLFGGNNAGGNILGKITVNVDHDYAGNTCAEGIRLDTIYGGGKNASYTPTVATTVSPTVHVVNDTITHNIFGAGYGSTAQCTSWPSVLLDPRAGGLVKVKANVYGGGSAAPVVGSTNVDANNSTIAGSVFGGGYGTTAEVDGDTKVHIRGLSEVGDNVYGGGNAGNVTGSTDVHIGDEE